MTPSVVQLSMYYIPILGGQETYIENLHQILKQNQYHAQVLQQLNFSASCKHVRMLPYIPKVFRWISDVRWFQFNVGLSLSRRFLRKADILICHYPFHYPAVQWHPRTIVLSHGVDWMEPPQTLADRYRIQALKQCQQKSPVVVANDTHFLRAFGIDIQPGTSAFQQVADKTWFIPNCIDTNHFKPLNLRRENVILVPRNIRRVRGIHLAILALKYFLVQHPDYQMWIAGSPLKGDYYQYCKNLSVELDIEDKVKFLGSVPWKNLVNYYNQSRLSLIPTIALEGTSLSALESMACKTPVVSTNVAGLKDLPTLQAIAEPQAIAAVMSEVVQNWEFYARRQYEAVTQNFNLHRWQEAWLRVIEQTLTL